MVAKGVSMRQDLYLLAASAAADDKETLDKVAEAAQEAASSSRGANTGSALHSFTERLDRGEQVAAPPTTATRTTSATPICAAGPATTGPPCWPRR
jgi:hypothetical protein